MQLVPEQPLGEVGRAASSPGCWGKQGDCPLEVSACGKGTVPFFAFVDFCHGLLAEGLEEALDLLSLGSIGRQLREKYARLGRSIGAPAGTAQRARECKPRVQ